MRYLVPALALLVTLVHTDHNAAAAPITIVYEITSGALGAPWNSPVTGGSATVLFPGLTTSGVTHTSGPILLTLKLTQTANFGLLPGSLTIWSEPGTVGGVHFGFDHAAGMRTASSAGFFSNFEFVVPTVVTWHATRLGWGITGQGPSGTLVGFVSGVVTSPLSFSFFDTFTGHEVSRSNPGAVPEPSVAQLAVAGLLGLAGAGAVRRRRTARR